MTDISQVLERFEIIEEEQAAAAAGGQHDGPETVTDPSLRVAPVGSGAQERVDEPERSQTPDADGQLERP